MPNNYTEKGKWRVCKETTFNTLPPFADAGWKTFKVLSGSKMFKKPQFEDLDPIRDNLSSFDVEIVKELTSGKLTTFFEAPATQGAANEIDLLLEALFGQVRTTAAMMGLVDGVAAGTVEVTDVDPNLKVGDAILLGTSGGDHVAVVTAITLNTNPTKDVLTILPDFTGSLSATTIPAGKYYSPKTGAVSGGLPTLAIQRLYDQDDEMWSWTGCKMNQMNFTSSPGGIIKPEFDILGIEEIKATETGTFSAPTVQNTFVAKNMFVRLDNSDITWVGNIGLVYSNKLAAQEGVEAKTGVSDHAEDIREVTIGLNFKYTSSAEIDKFKLATKREFMCYGRRTVGAATRYFVLYAPKLLATDLDTSVTGRLLKYDLTTRAYPKATAADDELSLSII